MRLMSFEHGGRSAAGVRLGDQVVPVAALAGFPDDPIALLEGGVAGLQRLGAAAAAAPASARLALAGLRRLMPIARPGKVVCIGLNYALHAKEGGNPIPDYPAVFLRVQTSLVGPDQPMLRPPCSSKLDYEAELAIIVGKRAQRARGDGAGPRGRLFAVQRRLAARLPAQVDAMDHGQELRRDRCLRPRTRQRR
jgi:hypothetical protein